MADVGPDSSEGEDLHFDGRKASAFYTTHWSSVLAAGEGTAGAEAALEELCSKYWYPIYAYVRRRGYDSHQAEDLTQAFFAYMFEKETLSKVDRQKGKFRTFLLTALTNFLANEWEKRRTLKRGGHQQIISLDETLAENLYRSELAEQLSSERLFDRRWASTLVELVLARLKQEYSELGKANLFAKLKSELTGEVASETYGAWSAALGMSEGALKVALHRLRRRFGELLRSEIAQTVANPADVDDEIRHLFAAISA